MPADDMDLTAELDEAEALVIDDEAGAVSGTAAALPVRLSVVVQMDPLWLHRQPGAGFSGHLKRYAEDMTSYLAANLERFGDPRGADLLLVVVAQRGDESAAQEYRSGHYVRDEDRSEEKR